MVVSTSRIKYLLAEIQRQAIIAVMASDPKRPQEDEADTPEGRIDIVREYLYSILETLVDLNQLLEAESRVEYVVQKLDKTNEARGAAIQAVGEFKRSKMTPEEIRAKAEKENDNLFGDYRRGKD